MSQCLQGSAAIATPFALEYALILLTAMTIGALLRALIGAPVAGGLPALPRAERAAFPLVVTNPTCAVGESAGIRDDTVGITALLALLVGPAESLAGLLIVVLLGAECGGAERHPPRTTSTSTNCTTWVLIMNTLLLSVNRATIQ